MVHFSQGVRMTVARLAPLVCSTMLVLFACSKNEQAATDTAAKASAAPAGAAAPAPPPAPTWTDFAGKWAVTATPVSSKETEVTKYTLVAPADPNGWMIEFPSGLKVPMLVTMSGDSLLVKTGEFASQRRKNVKVISEGSIKLQGGKLV